VRLGGGARRRVPFLDLAGVTGEVRDDVLAQWKGLLDSGQFVGGDAVTSFEDRFADYCGTAQAVGVGNGTDALQLTLRGLGIGPGTDVIVPANTFVATVEAVVLAGAQPRFADVDPDTLLLTPETIAAALTPRTRAVIAVHLYGRMPDMDAILACADRRGLTVVEDAAQAQGATWGSRRAGSFGVAGCFSFYPGKNLGAFGDAGAVVTSDAMLAERLRALRDHGRTGGGHYEHGFLGTNSRLDALQAVVLETKLDRLDAWNAARRELMAEYCTLIDPDVAVPVADLTGGQAVHHLAVFRVQEREVLRDALTEAGVGTGVHYPTPCHRMVPYAPFAHGPLPVAEAAAAQVISLPMYPHLDVEDVRYVAEQVNHLARVRRSA
jgi:dTDP-4-amino-4,6-dideoxygalactose transaminase